VRRILILVYVFFVSTSGGWFCANAAERTVLRENAITHGDSIRMSDLLPPGATEEIRARANSIALGNSPLPGAHRTFDRFQIENALRAAPELQAALLIPEQIDVMRWSRPLGREQIRIALQGSARASTDSILKDLALDQIEMPSAVLLTEEVARVAVLQIEPSDPGSDVHARLWIPSEPKVPAFWITVHRKNEYRNPSGSTGASAPFENDAPKNAQLPASYQDSPVSLKSGESVELFALAAGMRITSPAITLGIGGIGQQIRVRIPATGKIVMATVIGPRTVELKY
jgi:hypothetical protein